jgi:hypothetical protein
MYSNAELSLQLPGDLKCHHDASRMIVVGTKMSSKRKPSVLLDVVADEQPGGTVETLSEGGEGEGEGGVSQGASWRSVWIALRRAQNETGGSLQRY